MKKGCFHKNLDRTVNGPFVDPLFKHRYPTGANHPPEDIWGQLEERNYFGIWDVRYPLNNPSLCRAVSHKYLHNLYENH